MQLCPCHFPLVTIHFACLHQAGCLPLWSLSIKLFVCLLYLPACGHALPCGRPSNLKMIYPGYAFSMTRLPLISGLGVYRGPYRRRRRLHAEFLGSSHGGGVVRDRLRCADHQQQVTLVQTRAKRCTAIFHERTRLGQVHTWGPHVFIPLAPFTAGEFNHCPRVLQKTGAELSLGCLLRANVVRVA